MNDKTVNEHMSALIDNEWESESQLSAVLAKLEADDALKSKFERYHLARDVMHKDFSSSLDAGFFSRVSAAIAEEPPIVAFPRDDKSASGKVTSLHGRNQSRQSGQSSTSASSSSNRSQTAGIQSDTASAAVNPESPESVSHVGSQRGAQGGSDDLAQRRSAKTGNAAPKWKAGIGGLAVAASVALVSLVGLNTLQQSNSEDSATGNAIVADNSAPASSAVVNSRDTVGAQPVIQVQGQESPLDYVANTSTYWVIPNQKRNQTTEKRLNMFLSQHIENSPTANMGGMLPYSRLVGYDAVPQQDQPE